jgi:hypothetical protein
MKLSLKIDKKTLNIGIHEFLLFSLPFSGIFNALANVAGGVFNARSKIANWLANIFPGSTVKCVLDTTSSCSECSSDSVGQSTHLQDVRTCKSRDGSETYKVASS